MEVDLGYKKGCKNCVHYLVHYIKGRDQFHPTGGHCISKKPSGHFRKTDKVCECYNERNLIEEKEEQIRSATESLSSISKHIRELKQILKILADKNEERKNG